MLKNKFVLILLILLLAFVLRTYALTAVPPGLTHDEANHGREALDILDGVLLFYFPLNYGSEPLYSYTAAGSMLLFGKSLFSLRLVNVVFGVLAIGVTYLWVQRAFDRRVALLTAVLLAVSFWPFAAGREALRAGMLPFFMVGAVWYFWQIAAPPGEKQPHKTAWGAAVGFGICVAIT
ncbi:MAG: glycosyltransferase family 39 protein, partial [Anaerolineales bacterium]|nr:glycosyltransferase family 39 protein [Anaerolineales bacterium]